jgi:mono/diheme cytochrome c family protein
MRIVVGSVMVMALVVGVGIRAHGATPVQGDAAKIAAGKAAYAAQKCSTCHMIDKAGGKMASVLDGVGSKLKEEDIRKWLTATAEMEAKLPKKPTASMAAFMKTKKLSDADVSALVAYMSSLK